MIYNEDCLEGMKKIADGAVDMIASAPPYCVGASSNGVKSSFSDLNLMRPFYPSEKPVELMVRMIKNSSAEGDLVVDPFAGSGTTAIVALGLKRRFIGFELDETFYEIARKRIAEALAKKQQELF